MADASLSVDVRGTRVLDPEVMFEARAAAILCLFGAEIIHTSVIGIHLQDWVPAGLFFLAISLAEGIMAAALITVPSRRLYATAAVLSLSTVAVWMWSRSVGIPAGPHPGIAEPVGIRDLLSTVFEIVTALTLIPLASARPSRPTSEALRPYGRVVLMAVTVTLATLAALNAEVHSHDLPSSAAHDPGVGVPALTRSWATKGQGGAEERRLIACPYGAWFQSFFRQMG